MTIIKCKQCATQMIWLDVQRQYARLLKKGYTKLQAKEKLPLCHKCVTKVKKVQL